MTQRVRRRPHFRLLGVPVRMRPTALFGPLSVGLLTYGLARRQTDNTRDAKLLGLASALYVYPTELTHAVGHIVSARLAGAPMDEINWSLGAFTTYYNNDVTPGQHIGRSLGGPIASAIAALVWWLAWQTLKGTKLGALAQVACLQNFLVGVGVGLLPLPFVDGGVILKNVTRIRP